MLIGLYCNKIYDRSKLGGPNTQKWMGKKTWRVNKLVDQILNWVSQCQTSPLVAPPLLSGKNFWDYIKQTKTTVYTVHDPILSRCCCVGLVRESCDLCFAYSLINVYIIKVNLFMNNWSRRMIPIG